MKFTALILLAALTTYAAASEQGVRGLKKKRDHEEDRPALGLACNGGGFTAANGVGGIMRGFQQQTVTIDGEERPAMEAFDIISSLSGGIAPTYLYHYAMNTNSDEILDALSNSDPSKITMADLESFPEKSMFSSWTKPEGPALALAILSANMFKGSHLWSTAIANFFLLPYGNFPFRPAEDVGIRADVKSTPIIQTSMVGPTELFPSWIFEHQSQGLISEYNNEAATNLPRVADDDRAFFLLLEDLDPRFPSAHYAYYIQDNDYVVELLQKHGSQMPIPAFVTNEEIHIPFTATEKMEFDPVGNKTADPLSFEPVAAKFSEVSSPSSPVTFEKIVGMGTDNGVLARDRFLAIEAISEEVLDIPNALNIPTSDGQQRSMAFTDGGYNEYLGMIPLVQQKTRHIISIFNPSGISLGLGFIPNEFISDPLNSGLSYYGRYFGLVAAEVPIEADTFTAALDLSTHVFDLYSNGENQIVKLCRSLQSLHAAGEPTIVTLEGLDVVDNPVWGIKGGYKVDFTVIMSIGVPKKFAEKLPEDIATPPEGREIIEGGFFTNAFFSSVPNIYPAPPEFGQNIPGTNVTLPFPLRIGQSLPMKAAKLTQVMNSWSIERAWNGLKGIDGEEKFAGFSKLIEDVKNEKKRREKGKKKKRKKDKRN